MAQDPKNKKPDDASRLAALEASFGALQAENSRLTNLTTQLMATPQQVTQVIEQEQERGGPSVELDLTGLPDPTDPGYQKALGKRIKRALKAEREVVAREIAAIPRPQDTSAAQARDRFYAGVWDKFKAEHPNLAKFEGEVRGVTASKVAEIAARGLDVDRFIMADPAGFSRDVAAAADAHLKALGVDTAVKAKTEDAQRTPNGQPANQIGTADEDDNSAALEVFGARPTFEGGPGTGGKPAKQSNIIDEIKDMQKQMWGNRGPQLH